MGNHVTIVGAGVAGLAAAISARQAGFGVTLFERSANLTCQPGETLHPGIEPLLEMLGVWHEVQDMTSYRHLGIRTRSAAGITETGYGMTGNKMWRGMQIDRLMLKQILLEYALGLGAEIQFSSHDAQIVQAEGSKVHLRVGEREFSSDWVFDATGPSNWLRKHDRSDYQAATRNLSVCYGYDKFDETSVHKDWPEFQISRPGWTWRAFIGRNQMAWAKLYVGKPAADKLFEQRTGVADATWKLSTKPAEMNRFRIGDAAFRMDPSTGKGVLRAIMSAMMAVHLAKQHEFGNAGCSEIANTYSTWLSKWFWTDFHEMITAHPWMASGY